MIRFPSIKNSDKIGYAWGYESNSYRNRVAYDAHQFMTYGDGMCQHSPMGNLEPGNTIDFLYSMADHLLKNPADLDIARSGWAYDESVQTIAFLASLHWKEGKTKYYSFGDMKVSSADSKRYDKRWAEIPEYADGTLNAVYRMFLANRGMDLFHQIHLINQICDWFSDSMGSSWSVYGKDCFLWLRELAPGKDEWDCWRPIRDAYSMVDRQIRAHYMTYRLKQWVDQYREAE